MMIYIRSWGIIFRALSTVLLLLLFMHLNMLIKISLLCKRLTASIILTLKRSFFSVNSEMIKKVVPLAEKHTAFGVFTLKDLDKSLSLRVLILVNLELSGAWYCFINFELLSIKSITWYNLHSVNWFRYLSSYFDITNFITSYYFGHILIVFLAVIITPYRLFSFGFIVSSWSFGLFWLLGGCFVKLNYCLGFEIGWGWL